MFKMYSHEEAMKDRERRVEENRQETERHFAMLEKYNAEILARDRALVAQNEQKKNEEFAKPSRMGESSKTSVSAPSLAASSDMTSDSTHSSTENSDTESESSTSRQSTELSSTETVSTDAECSTSCSSDSEKEDGNAKTQSTRAGSQSSKPDCAKCIESQGKIERLLENNQNLTCDFEKCQYANNVLKTNEKDLKRKIELLEKENIENNSMIKNLENMLAQARSDYEKANNLLGEATRQKSVLERKVEQIADTAPNSILSQVVSLTDCADCLKLVGKVDQQIDHIKILDEQNERLSRENSSQIIKNESLTKSEKTIEQHN